MWFFLFLDMVVLGCDVESFSYFVIMKEKLEGFSILIFWVIKLINFGFFFFLDFLICEKEMFLFLKLYLVCVLFFDNESILFNVGVKVW